MKIVSEYGFNIDGWEEVWEFEIKDEETGRGTGLYDIYDPSVQGSLFKAKYVFLNATNSKFKKWFDIIYFDICQKFYMPFLVLNILFLMPVLMPILDAISPQ